MRPVVLSAIFLTVVLMNMPDTGNAYNDIAATCRGVVMRKCRESDWYQLSGRLCIKVNLNSLSFRDAEQDCSRQRGVLVPIMSATLNKIVTCYLYNTYSARVNYWIGATRSRGGFRWLMKNQPMRYTNWQNNQPDNFQLNENCVEINHEEWGRWNDQNCDARRPSVCAKII